MINIYDLVHGLRETLAPVCERIEIAGSIRRGKLSPKDIEIVCIPRLAATEQAGLFDAPIAVSQVNFLEETIAALVTDDMTLLATGWEFDSVLKRNGPNYKRLWHRYAHIACDLFITDARRWGTIYAIRTGPGAFSKALVTRALSLGMFVEEGLLHHHRRQYKVINGESIALPCPKGETCSLVTPTPEERDFFTALQVPFWEPNDRSDMRFAEWYERLKG